MIAAFVLAVAIDSAQPATVDTSDALERVERWIDTSLDGAGRNRERHHLYEKGAGKTHRSVSPTFYESPFEVRREAA